MKEAWETIKTFLGGWGIFTFGIVAVAVLLYAIYVILKAMLF